MTHPLYTEESQRTHIESHQAHIQAGGCPSVARTKAWCNARSRAPHEHYARGDNAPTESWTDREAAGCPCDSLPGGALRQE